MGDKSPRKREKKKKMVKNITVQPTIKSEAPSAKSSKK